MKSMAFALISFMVLLGSLTSCVGGEKKSEVTQPERKYGFEGDHKAYLDNELKPNFDRAPASWSEEKAKNTFEAILEDENYAERFYRFSERMARIYDSARTSLKKFDTKLDQEYRRPKNVGGPRAGYMMCTLEYARMLWLYDFWHEMRHEALSLYELALEELLVENPTVDRLTRVRTMLRYYKVELDSKDVAQRLTLSVFARGGIEVQERLKKLHGSKIREPDAEFFDASYWDNVEFTDHPGGIKAFIKENEKIQAAERHKFKRMQISQQTLDKGGKAVLEKMKEAGYCDQREPAQLAKIAPGTGKTGNVVGREFPTGTWALTYDDGPSGKFTPMILQDLANHQDMKVTFFWLAQSAKVNPTIVKNALAAGHEIASHSWSHQNLPKMNPATQKKEISDSVDAINAITGQQMRFFRLPYGSGLNVPEIRQQIADKGLIHVFWNVDTLDWQDKNPDVVFERARKQIEIEKRGVILFHDVHAQSEAASNRLMTYLRQSNAKMVRMSEVVDDINSKRP